MRYIIFGSDKSNIKIPLHKAEKVTTNLQDAIEYFNRMNADCKYMYTWLICDFEVNKKLKYTPYLILAKWHYGISYQDTTSKDTISVEYNGFKHIFYNNIDALNEFLNYYDKAVPCILKLENKNDETIIADTFNAHRAENKITYNKKYQLLYDVA